MNRKIKPFVLALFLLLAATLPLAFLPQPALAQTPITNCTELQNIRNDLAADYYLANDIDCACTSGWNGGAGFEPIGSDSKAFTGTLDGKGYKITRLYINRPSTDNVGLFGVTSGSEIKDVGLEEVDVRGDKCVGGLVGDNLGQITNSYSSGSVTGSDYNVGGLVGENDETITNSYSSGSVTGSDYNVGGLVGISFGTITNSYSSGTVTGSDDSVGGLAGSNWGGTITNSYSSGSVSGNSEVGGLAGDNFGTITNSYSSGSVSGSSKVGGLVGDNFGEFVGTITNSYSSGSVSGNSEVGGLVGAYEEGTITNCYWDIYRSGRSNCVGSGSSSGCTGKNSDNSEQDYWYNSTHAPMDKWDFDNIWGILEGVTYPYLQWQVSATDLPDLVIADKWEKGKTDRYKVFFVVENIGSATAPRGHYATLYVDGMEKENLLVRMDLKPGKSYRGIFRTKIRVSGDSDTIKVCADYFNVVEESDEDNNCLENLWP